MSDEHQLSRIPSAPVDWQTRAERAESTIARVREVAERHAALDVSNGSWKAAARHCGAQILAALEGK